MSKIVDIARKYIGYPSILYESPDVGKSVSGFDCSGFVQFILLESGLSIPQVPGTTRQIRHSEEFMDFFGVLVHPEMREPGDLVFFSRNGVRPTHIGIYSSEDMMIHTGGNNKLVEEINLSDYVKSRTIKFDYSKGHKQIYVTNPIAYKRPTVQTSKNRYQQLI